MGNKNGQTPAQLGARRVAEMSANAIQTDIYFRKETLFMTSTKICEDTPPVNVKH